MGETIKRAKDDAIALALGDLELRKLLEYSYPTNVCALCGAPADALYQITWETTNSEKIELESPTSPAAHEAKQSYETWKETWVEYDFGCSWCFFSEWGKGLKKKRSLPLRSMNITDKRGVSRRLVFEQAAKKIGVHVIFAIRSIASLSPAERAVILTPGWAK